MSFLLSPTGRKRKLPVIVARLFNTVVPGNRTLRNVLPNFVKSALDNTAISIYGTGSNLVASAMCATPSKDSSASWTQIVPSAKSSTSQHREITIEAWHRE